MKKRIIIERTGVKVDEFIIEKDGKEYGYKIQAPTFSQLSEGMTESMSRTGKLNMTGGGKVIFELCCTECSPEIEQDPSLLMSISMNLYNEYVLPGKTEIKKK